MSAVYNWQSTQSGQGRHCTAYSGDPGLIELTAGLTCESSLGSQIVLLVAQTIVTKSYLDIQMYFLIKKVHVGPLMRKRVSMIPKWGVNAFKVGFI